MVQIFSFNIKHVLPIIFQVKSNIIQNSIVNFFQNYVSGLQHVLYPVAFLKIKVKGIGSLRAQQIGTSFH